MTMLCLGLPRGARWRVGKFRCFVERHTLVEARRPHATALTEEEEFFAAERRGLRAAARKGLEWRGTL